MTDLPRWQEENTRYLSAAVAEVRTRLDREAQKRQSPALIEGSEIAKTVPSQGVGSQDVASPGVEVALDQPESRSFWRWFGRGNELAHVVVPVAEKAEAAQALPSPASATTKGEAALVPAEPLQVPEAGEDAIAPPALVTLALRMMLTGFERDVLLLCIAAELDTGLERLCAQAQGDDGRAYPTFALALTVFDEPGWEALSPERPLRYWKLIEITQAGGQPLTTSRLRADERIVNYVKGLNYLDDRVSSLMSPLEVVADTSTKPASQEETEAEVLQRLKQGTGSPGPVVQLIGRDSATKEAIAANVCAGLKLRLYRMPAALIPAQVAEVEPFARLWQRESLLLPGALYLDAQNTEPESAAGQAVSLLVARARRLIFLDTRDSWAGSRAIAVAVDKPTPEEQRALWNEALGEASDKTAQLMAGQFDLSAMQIRAIACRVYAEASPGDVADSARTADPVDPVHLADLAWTAALAANQPVMDSLAQSIESKAGWDDIVLPAAEMGALHEIADQVVSRTVVYRDWGFGEKMSRGLGITALFAGPSGTGKTLAAEVLANTLKLQLYRVDLSSVVSKYIGETEKNLRRLFDAAESGGSILFFDEADALFGKRSEVKDSHDRYANIEVNYLLQRMESYRGLALLATNAKSALDAAFVRRLRFIVTFPFPGAAERKAIWERVFPAKAHVEDLDYARLARLNVTGGHIHNIALNAAFRAARAGTPVTMSLILEAARNEFRKLERPVNEADFRLPGAA